MRKNNLNFHDSKRCNFQKIAIMTIASITTSSLISITMPNNTLAEENSLGVTGLNEISLNNFEITKKKNEYSTENPDKPIMDYVVPGGTKVTGRAEPNSMITVMIPGQGVYQSKEPVSSNGLFNVEIPPQKAGTYIFVHTTIADHESNVQQVIVGEGEGELAYPEVNEVKDTDAKITGKTKPGSNIIVKVDGKEMGVSQGDINGAFSIGIPKQKAGTKISVTASDSTGASKAAEVTVKETIPTTPEVNEVKDTDEKIMGKTKPGSNIIVKVDGKEIGASQADGNGDFSIDIPKQKAGTKLSVIAWNNTGTSEETRVMVKQTPPSAPEVNEVKDTDEKIIGKVKPYSIVTVRADGNVIAQNLADGNGDFSIDIPKQKAGTKLSVIAWNNTGTSEETELTVKEENPAPIVDYIAIGGTKVTGKAEPNSMITVMIPGQGVYQSKEPVSSNGLFNVEIPPQEAGTYIFVHTTIADHESNVQQVIVGE